MRLSQTTQFAKDIKRQVKRGKDPEKLTAVLMERKTLPAQYKDHSLRGDWKNRRDCQLEPDWILVYRISDEELRLERTGSHSDLF